MKPIIQLCIVLAAALVAGPVICVADKIEIPVTVAKSHASIKAYANAIISLKDANTGSLFYVESNGRRLVAFGKDGSIRWSVDVLEATNITPKVGARVIRYLRLEDGRLLVTFGKDDHAEVEIINGKTRYLGADAMPSPDKIIVEPKSGRYAQVGSNKDVVSLYEQDGKTVWSTNVIEAVKEFVGTRTNEFPRVTDRKIQGVQLYKGELWVDLVRGYAVLDVKTGKFKGVASN